MRDLKPAGNMLLTILLTLTAATGITACLDSSSDPPPDPGALTITTGSPLPSGNKAIPYSTTLAAAGGKPGYTWSVKTGPGLDNLPAGLQLSAAGVISGTPTTIETRSPVFNVVDTSPLPQAVEKTLAISINVVQQPTISAPASLPNGIVGITYSATLTATGGTPPYTIWSVSPDLPSGLTFDIVTATISGTPQAATGTTNHTFSVTDSFSPVPQTDTRNYSLTISPAPLTLSITTPSLLPGTVAQSYSQSLAAFGGTPPLTWSRVSGSLPPGLQLNQSNGAITGVPTTVGSFSPRFRVRDAGTPQQSDEKTLSITITLPAAPSITTTSLPAGSFNAAYSQTVQVTGGIGTLVWGVTSGALPPGLDLDASNGNISGNPTMTGSFNFRLRVTDQIPQFDEQNLTITINLPAPLTITAPSSLPTGTVTQTYPPTTLTASGGTAPFTWDPVVNPALPNGLSWNAATHTISGIPLDGSQGTENHTFTVRDSTNPVLTATRTYSLTINLPAPPNITTTTPLPNGTVTQPYSRTLQHTGGTAPFTWSFTGTLPTGLTLNTSTGEISGTPTAADTFNFTPQVIDALSQDDDTPPNLSITIDLPAPPTITTTSPLPNGTVASAYSQTVQATGGTGALTWIVSAGSLPTGLNPINPSTGQISGTPSAAGTFNFTVRATDTLQSVDQPLSITIDLPAPPNITTTSPLPNGTVGTAYSHQVNATGGIGNLSWSISAGLLPPGLDIKQDTGEIFGTPTTADVNPFNFTVQVTDTIPQSDTQDLSIMIDP